MKLIEADKVERAIKDYWKAQVDKALTLTFTDGNEADKRINSYLEHNHELLKAIDELPSVQPERKTGQWILDRSGRYCCNRCMEPCAGYVMMKPRDKFCKMCGSRNEVTE